ncbi:hypothetical protein AAZX31_04G140300 [Glycine max]
MLLSSSDYLIQVQLRHNYVRYIDFWAHCLYIGDTKILLLGYHGSPDHDVICCFLVQFTIEYLIDSMFPEKFIDQCCIVDVLVSTQSLGGAENVDKYCVWKTKQNGLHKMEENKLVQVCYSVFRPYFV